MTGTYLGSGSMESNPTWRAGARRRRRARADAEPRTRVAYLVPPSAHFAGIERVVHEIASGLAETHGDRLDVHVVHASDYDSELLRHTSYTRHVLGVGRLLALPGPLRRCVAAQRFDVLVCPQVEASVIAWLATAGLGLSVFLPHLHGNPKVEESDGGLRTRAAFHIFRHFVSRRSAAVLAVSPSLARYAAVGVVRGSEVHYVANPVRELLPPPDRERRDTEPFRFVTVARLSRQKGQDVLLRALALARPDLPAFSLTLVGSGPDREELEALCHTLDLDDVVEFAGYVAEPAAELARADCFVLPSRWEGFGVALVEALQVGLPVLAADCDFGPADIVTDPRLGELVPAQDEWALAAGLVRAAARPSDGAGASDGAGVSDAEFRRAAGAAYGRAPAVRSQFEVLQQIAASHPDRRGRLGPLLR